MPGCLCQVCTSSDPRDRRLRASLLVQYSGRNIVIDCGPDFREQVLRAGLRRLDTLLITHDHADHLHGMDDIRSFNHVQGERIPCFAPRSCIQTIRQRFSYFFGPPCPGGGRPDIELLEVGQRFELFGLEVLTIPVEHGLAETVGYRFAGLAYLPDAKGIPESSKKLLLGLDTLVIDALRPEPHPTHLSLGEAIELVEELKPRRAFLTHISHRLSHASTSASLPENIYLACDGLVLETSFA